MEIITTRFTIKGRWDGDRNGSGVMVTNDVNIPVSAPAEFDGPGLIKPRRTAGSFSGNLLYNHPGLFAKQEGYQIFPSGH